MLASILIILSNPSLIGGLLLCVIIGGISFLAAIHLCGAKGLGVSTLKYVLTFISIESLSSFFMIVLAPLDFLTRYNAFYSIHIIMGFLLVWVLFYEARWLFKKPFIDILKSKLKIGEKKCLQ